MSSLWRRIWCEVVWKEGRGEGGCEDRVEQSRSGQVRPAAELLMEGSGPVLVVIVSCAAIEYGSISAKSEEMRDRTRLVLWVSG